MSRILLLGFAASLTLCALAYATLARWGIDPVSRLRRNSRLDRLMSEAKKRLMPHFDLARVSFPPASVAIVYFKDEQRLLLYAGPTASQLKEIKGYPVLAASGTRGPKLKEGDLQVPEGFYAIEGLNPRSQFHLSLRVNYPNAFDREQAKKEGRSQLGGDIMIHGGAASIGCIAIGDPGIEEIFAVAKETPFQKWRVLLSPTDFRKQKIEAIAAQEEWVRDLYRRLAAEIALLP